LFQNGTDKIGIVLQNETFITVKPHFWLKNSVFFVARLLLLLRQKKFSLNREVKYVH
jgi:hypothetical protein